MSRRNPWDEEIKQAYHELQSMAHRFPKLSHHRQLIYPSMHRYRQLHSRCDACLLWDFLIDSFEGLSEITKSDIPLNPNVKIHKKGDLRENFETVEINFKEYNNVFLVKGWIPDVFDQLDQNNKYKFVHLDVDLYQPTLDSLEYIYEKVVKGGVIITDDYKSPLFPGNKKAWEHYFNSKNIKNWLALPSGQAAIIKS